MSVYTWVREDELAAFLGDYDVGALVSYRGISDGIENTNYFVDTDGGRYVLTLFEWLPEEDLPYFLNLMAFLAERGIPSPHPVATREGHYLNHLKDKPTALVHRLPGASVLEPSAAQCRAVGETLGRMHAEGRAFPQTRDNDRGPRWWRATIQRLLPHVSAEDAQLLRDEMHFQSLFRFADLPRGVVHADLFRDNVLLEGDSITGVIDFYYACNDVLLYDVAVTANDWCSMDDGSLDSQRVRAVLDGYNDRRPLEPIERGAWPVMLRAAALRFWVSRLQDLHFPRPGEITHTKDPDVFKRILQRRIERQAELQSLWV